MAQLVELQVVTREVVSSTPAGPQDIEISATFRNYIRKWLDFQVFSDKDYKP